MTEHDLVDAPPHPVAGDSALQSQTLESVASAYNDHAWLRHLAMPYLGSHPLELGSGLGDCAQSYLEATSKRAFPASVVSEADPVRLGMLRRRFESQPRVAVLQLDLRAAPEREHSSVVATLRAAFGQAGLAVDRLHYVNAPGLPAWIVGMRLLRMTPGDGRLLRVWDRLVIPAARRAGSRWTPPFGAMGSPCSPSAACGPNPSI